MYSSWLWMQKPEGGGGVHLGKVLYIAMKLETKERQKNTNQKTNTHSHNEQRS